MTTNPSQPEITYPCEVPIKAMGLAHVNFDRVIVEIVRRHAPDVDESTVRSRPSANGKYVSITVTITADSRAQLEAIYLDLKACEQVLMTL
jgi:uncharacterized protein